MSRTLRKSRYANVHWHRHGRRWQAKVHVDYADKRLRISLGYSKDEEVCAQIADCANALLYGPNANLNFPERRGDPPDGVSKADVLMRLLRSIEQACGLDPGEGVMFLYPHTN